MSNNYVPGPSIHFIQPPVGIPPVGIPPVGMPPIPPNIFSPQFFSGPYIPYPEVYSEIQPWNNYNEVDDEIDNIDNGIGMKIVKKANKNSNRCYTCKPRGKVKNHIINSSTSGKFIFHHDMHKRPVIIVTSSRHIQRMDDMTNDEKLDLYKSISEFASFWKIESYQISINVGDWQNHEHFHCKIRIAQNIINKMRRDHFSKLKLEKRYYE